MRRLQDKPPASPHRALLELPANQRLFVQRWIELFDWNVDVQFQVRPASRENIESELCEPRLGFHSELLQEELNGLPSKPPQFSYELISSDPVHAAEVLAADSAAADHHPVYLFHGHRSLLDSKLPDMACRVDEMKRKWSGGISKYHFCFRTIAPGSKPASFEGTRMELVPWLKLGEDLRTLGAGWLSGARSLERLWVFRIASEDNDVNGALESALRTYYNYRGCVKTGSPSSDPIGLDLSEVLVEYPDDPSRKSRILPIQARRFRMRGGVDGALRSRLERAAQSWGLFADLVRNFGAAVDHLRAGDLDSALEAFTFNQDLGLRGYGSQLPNERNWGRPRLLVEIGSRLLAMDFPRKYFKYLATYCGASSHAVDLVPGQKDSKYNRTLIVDPNPWWTIVEDLSWAKVIARAKWDELLKYRRREFVQMMANLRRLRTVQRVAVWDLSRAVRARNRLVHHGQYLAHHRVLGVLLDVNELLILLRLTAFERAPTRPDAAFLDVVNKLRADFDDCVSGAFPASDIWSLCIDGWEGIGRSSP